MIIIMMIMVMVMTTGEVKDEDDAARLAIDVGYPVMIKVTFYILPYSFLSLMSCTVVTLIFIFTYYHLIIFVISSHYMSSQVTFCYTIALISLIYVYLPYLLYTRIISSFAIRFSIINCRICLIPITTPAFQHFIIFFLSFSPSSYRFLCFLICLFYSFRQSVSLHCSLSFCFMRCLCLSSCHSLSLSFCLIVSLSFYLLL